MTPRPTTAEGAIELILARVPELQSIYESHLGSDGELLPYVLFEVEFMEWFLSGLADGPPDEPRRRFLDAVEEVFARDFEGMDTAANLAHLGLVDTVLGFDGAHLFERLEPWLGPATRAEFARELARRER